MDPPLCIGAVHRLAATLCVEPPPEVVWNVRPQENVAWYLYVPVPLPIFAGVPALTRPECRGKAQRPESWVARAVC